MQTTLPLVTLGIPSYNSGEFLKFTLESVLNQTMQNFECIVVDDCSTDGSARYFTQVVGTDPRFRLIKHKMNCGLAASRNTIIRSARCKFTAFLDSDDLIMPNSLETRAATCLWGGRQSDRFVGSYGGSVSIEEHEKTPPPATPSDPLFIDWVSSNGICPFNANQPMLRTDVLRASGGFNQYLTQSEDYDLWLRILRAGYSFAPAKWNSITYRKRAGSMIRRGPFTHLKTALALFNSSQFSLGDDQLQWSAYRLTKPLYHYTAQWNKMTRIFEFCGMSIASETPPDLEEVANVILSEMPDLRFLLGPHSNMYSLILKGVKRQTGGRTGSFEGRIRQLVDMVNAASNEAKPVGEPATEAVLPYATPEENLLWSANAQLEYDIVFIPHSGYHVWTISLLMEGFRKRGVKVAVVDISPQWRDGGVRKSAEQYDIPLFGMSEFVLGRFAWKNIIVFNDWDPVTRPILVAAQECGIQTTAIVEGIQDYDDADVHWTRHAYKTADTILLPGDFDQKYFKDTQSKCVVVGVPRIQILRKEKSRNQSNEKKARVLINSNFSYGVLEEHRDDWLRDAVEAVLEAGLTPVISRHPGDKGEGYPQYVTDETFYECLETCEISVQRFASGVLEALARDVGVIYYNPHGEKVDKFQTDTMSSYVLSTTARQLKADLDRWKEIRQMAMTHGSAFLDHHSGRGDVDLLEATVDAIVSNMGETPNGDSVAQFKEYLNAIDIETLSMTACVRPDGPLFPDPGKARRLLKKLHETNCGQVHSLRVHLKQPRAVTAPTPVVKTEVKAAPDPGKVQPLSLLPAEANTEAVVRNAASFLLLTPEDTLGRVEPGGDLHDPTQAALASLKKDDPLRLHFDKTLEFAKAKSGKRKGA